MDLLWILVPGFFCKWMWPLNVVVSRILKTSSITCQSHVDFLEWRIHISLRGRRRLDYSNIQLISSGVFLEGERKRWRRKRSQPLRNVKTNCQPKNTLLSKNHFFFFFEKRGHCKTFIEPDCQQNYWIIPISFYEKALWMNTPATHLLRRSRPSPWIPYVDVPNFLERLSIKEAFY